MVVTHAVFVVVTHTALAVVAHTAFTANSHARGPLLAAPRLPLCRLELRGWELQARAGEIDAWTTLRRHDGDASLQGGHSVAAFEVTQHMGTAFRHSRLHQHGPNASGLGANGGHRLVCGGLELYGTLLDGAAYD